ncbi:MAG: DEAD/DEAH box helicase [Gammaproteobacteria bacterium]|nr:DEAD/DEAH box helicase [Gammaproteobacteria bacterium]
MAKKKKQAKVKKPAIVGWKTTDEDEIVLRQQRGATELMRVEKCEPDYPYYANFRVKSERGNGYQVEIRSLSQLINACDCPDYQHNRLGTCKHIEKVLYTLQRKAKRQYQQADALGSSRIEIYADTRHEMGVVSVHAIWPKRHARGGKALLSPYFSNSGKLLGAPESALAAVKRTIATASKALQKQIRMSQHIDRLMSHAVWQKNREQARQAFIGDVKQGKASLNFLNFPLYPYQQEGVLHLAFNERALLADEMGLGKTVQAIAACELLRRQGKVNRVLVVATASLKAEWADQIKKFCSIEPFIVTGTRAKRLLQYQQPHFLYLTNYEQIRRDYQAINDNLLPDVVILDEAQRIKNWRTKTAATIKQLKSRYAFVLTGTPLENRIDDIYSIVQFLDPHLFGPLFRFNREFYQLDERGRAIGYKNLDQLNQRLKPVMLRRQKSDVEGELPERTIKHYFIPMEEEQRLRYEEYEQRASRLAHIAEKRPLTKEEMQKLQQFLACMRMVCDTPYILDPACRISPKLTELTKILEELLNVPHNHVIIFSEWVRMLELVAEHCQVSNWDYAWHTGSVEQKKRYKEITRFKNDENCRLFLSSDSGSVGLNLQKANIVINLDLPWNPAKLEQRIARAWRKHQSRTVHVINLVAEASIEHRMIHLLEQKQKLATSVLQGDEVTEMPLPSSRAAFMEQLNALLGDQFKAEANVSQGDASPEQTLQTLSQEVLARHQNSLESLAMYQTADDKKTLLAVVDGDDPSLKQSIADTHHHMDKQNAYAVETLDRSTFNLLKRLADAGIITLQVPTETLFSNQPEQGSTIDPEWLKQAKAQLKLAERHLNMADYLIQGEFVAESINPLQQAFSDSVKAFIWLKGESGQLQQAMHSSFIEECLINTHGLSRQALVLLSLLPVQKKSPILDEEALDLVPRLHNFYQYMQSQVDVTQL